MDFRQVREDARIGAEFLDIATCSQLRFAATNVATQSAGLDRKRDQWPIVLYRFLGIDVTLGKEH